MLVHIITKKDGEGRSQRRPYLEAPAGPTCSKANDRSKRRQPPAARVRNWLADPVVVQEIRSKRLGPSTGARTGRGEATSMAACRAHRRPGGQATLAGGIDDRRERWGRRGRRRRGTHEEDSQRGQDFKQDMPSPRAAKSTEPPLFPGSPGWHRRGTLSPCPVAVGTGRLLPSRPQAAGLWRKTKKDRTPSRLRPRPHTTRAGAEVGDRCGGGGGGGAEDGRIF
jgi:hypothetical protein